MSHSAFPSQAAGARTQGEASCGITISRVLRNNNKDYVDLLSKVNQLYDKAHPVPRLKQDQQMRVVDYLRRCVAIEPVNAMSKFADRTFLLSNITASHKTALIQSSCIGSDSFGNIITHYFENMLCAAKVGIPFISVAKVYDPKKGHFLSPFINALPSLVLPGMNRSASSSTQQSRTPLQLDIMSINRPHENIVNKMKKVCRCPSGCHERVNALWIRNLQLPRVLIRRSLDLYVKSLTTGMDKQDMGSVSTVLIKEDTTNGEVGDKWPLVPDVAIHYRCGDNFVHPYGFLPFAALDNSIRNHYSSNSGESPKYIYVLADARGRKTSTPAKAKLTQKCDSIFASLYEHLSKAFPQASIVIRRGGDLYLDMYRLSQAKVTICSVSTFCLWPAIANKNHAYFPRSALIVAGNTNIDLGFYWIKEPPILKGHMYAKSPIHGLLQALRAK